jgi:hypothetical protein
MNKYINRDKSQYININTNSIYFTMHRDMIYRLRHNFKHIITGEQF